MHWYSGRLAKDTTVGLQLPPPVARVAILTAASGALSISPTFGSAWRAAFAILFHQGFSRHTKALHFRFTPNKHSVVSHSEASHRRPKCPCKQVSHQVPRPGETTHRLPQQSLTSGHEAVVFSVFFPAVHRSHHHILATLRTRYVTNDFSVSKKSRHLRLNLFVVHRFSSAASESPLFLTGSADAIPVCRFQDLFAVVLR